MLRNVSTGNNIFSAIRTFQPYVDAQNISIYLSMPRGEVQTTAIVSHALESGKNVFVPYLHKPKLPFSHKPGRVMDMVRLKDLQDYHSLERDKWGIPSVEASTVDSRERVLGIPDASGKLPPNAGSFLDLIIVPGVAFDMDAETGCIRRLGHGRGFYDQFISRYSKTENAQKRPPVLLYGLALTQQFLGTGSDEPVPVTSHDKPLDGLILGDGGIKIATSAVRPAATTSPST